MQERARRYKVEKRKDNPEGPFYLFWAENGRQRRRSTGLYDPGLAQALAHKLNAEEAERAVFGRAVIEERVTFAYAALAYCKAGETEQERAARERYMTIPIKRLGDYALRAITDDIMRDESRKAYPLASPATRRRQFYTPALAVMNWASKRARGWCERPDFDRPPDSKGRTEWVKPETADRIILAAKDARARAPLELGFGAGMRASEVARLDWSDVYLSAGQIRVRGTKTAAADRMVDIPSRTVAALANLKGKEGPVCLTPKGEPYKIRDGSGGLFNDALRLSCENAEAPYISFHILRHSWATWRASADKDLLRLKEQGGWSSLKMVERYAKIAPRGTGAEAAKLGWDFGSDAAMRPPVENDEAKSA